MRLHLRRRADKEVVGMRPAVVFEVGSSRLELSGYVNRGYIEAGHRHCGVPNHAKDARRVRDCGALLVRMSRLQDPHREDQGRSDHRGAQASHAESSARNILRSQIMMLAETQNRSQEWDGEAVRWRAERMINF